MAYVRAKTIRGNTYYYLQEGHWVNGKVVSKHLKYLGKNPPPELGTRKKKGVSPGDPPSPKRKKRRPKR